MYWPEWMCVFWRGSSLEGAEPHYPQLTASPQSMDSVLTAGDGKQISFTLQINESLLNHVRNLWSGTCGLPVVSTFTSIVSYRWRKINLPKLKSQKLKVNLWQYTTFLCTVLCATPINGKPLSFTWLALKCCFKMATQFDSRNVSTRTQPKCYSTRPGFNSHASHEYHR